MSARKRPKPDIETATTSGGPRRRLCLAAIVILLGVMVAWIVTAAMRAGAGGAPVAGYEVLASYPHDPQAYCQGLTFDAGRLWEGTGRYGTSSLREVDLESGRILRRVDLSDDLFGEGIAVAGDRIYQLTWKNGLALVYDKTTLHQMAQHTYQGQGWGLTYDGRHLIMSDGSSTLRRLDPETFRQVGRLQVREHGRPISKLNELEYVDGEIYANLWYRDRIARISAETGAVLGWIDLATLFPESQRDSDEQVLNGIAYDAATKRLWVTGKNWPRLYQIRMVPR